MITTHLLSYFSGQIVNLGCVLLNSVLLHSPFEPNFLTQIRAQARRDIRTMLFTYRKIWKGKFWESQDQTGEGRPEIQNQTQTAEISGLVRGKTTFRI